MWSLSTALSCRQVMTGAGCSSPGRSCRALAGWWWGAPTLDDIQAFFKNDPYQLKGLAVYRFAEFNPVKQQAFLEDWVAGK
jgi:hypothetical protein